MSDTTTNQVEIVLIRHGKTEGNKEKRYIGRTDQPLSEEGIVGIKENLGRYPSVEKVYASPMKRTRQTAELIYPGQASELVDGLREMDMTILYFMGGDPRKDQHTGGRVHEGFWKTYHGCFHTGTWRYAGRGDQKIGSRGSWRYDHVHRFPTG